MLNPTQNPKEKTALLAALPRLYEKNYQTLSQLIPGLQNISHQTQLTLNDIEQLSITIDEQCRYTTIINIDHLLNNALLPDLTMTIRIYHDARMAEVIRSQHHSRFKPSYSYPNELMHQPLEKRQINLFFEDWLKHCIEISHQQRIQKAQQQSPS